MIDSPLNFKNVRFIYSGVYRRHGHISFTFSDYSDKQEQVQRVTQVFGAFGKESGASKGKSQDFGFV
jgi:hypothetical protein